MDTHPYLGDFTLSGHQDHSAELVVQLLPFLRSTAENAERRFALHADAADEIVADVVILLLNRPPDVASIEAPVAYFQSLIFRRARALAALDRHPSGRSVSMMDPATLLFTPYEMTDMVDESTSAPDPAADDPLDALIEQGGLTAGEAAVVLAIAVDSRPLGEVAHELQVTRREAEKRFKDGLSKLRHAINHGTILSDLLEKKSQSLPSAPEREDPAEASVRRFASQLWSSPEIVNTWLRSPNAFLDGARPINVLARQGPGRLFDALAAEVAGVYA